MKVTMLCDCAIGLLLAGAGYVYTCTYLRGKKMWDGKGADLSPNRNKTVYIVVSLLCVFSVILCLVGVHSALPIERIRLLCLTGTLIPAAAVDFRAGKIPNQLLAASAAVRLLLYIPEFILFGRSELTELKSDLLGAAVIAGFFLLMLLVFRNSIGMGDIKLFAVMGFYEGISGVLNSMFWSLAVCFVIAAALLVTKKKGRRDTIPFGPCALVGTVFSICFAGM